MEILPSSPTVSVVLSPSPWLLKASAPLAVTAEASHPAKSEELNARSEKIIHVPSPRAGYHRYKPDHKASTLQGILATGDDAESDTMPMSKKIADTGANAKSAARGTTSQQARLARRSNTTTTSVVVDDKTAQSIMTASDRGIADLAKSFSDPEHFPEWYMKLPEGQRNMFNKKAEDKKADVKKSDDKDDKKVDKKKQKGKVSKTTKNDASSALGINTVLKIGTLAMLCMAMM
ncbi:hypothetical protein DV738_g1488, partial [Chaetothyriales sp. CBS 135597]